MLAQWLGDQAIVVNQCGKYAFLYSRMVLYEYKRLRRITPLRAAMRRNYPPVRLNIEGIPRHVLH